MKREVSDTILARKIGEVSSEERLRLLSFLPETIAIPTTAAPLSKDLSLKELFNKIHPSWYAPYMNLLSAKDRLLFLSALGKESPYVLSTPLSLFLLNHLFHRVFREIPLPPSFFAEDRLAPLAFASFAQLKRLIRLLSLFDLVPELKKVLEAKLLQKIEGMLSEEECAYLEKIQTDRNQLQFSPIGLQNWDGNIEKLQEVLLDRGMNRLAKALAISSKDLLWYIEHTMDPPYAKKFLSLLSPVPNSRMVTSLIEQVLTTWRKICTPSP